LRVTLFRDSAEQLGTQAETFKGRGNGFLLSSAWEEVLPTGSGRNLLWER
jgi:hypothetical protein